MAKRKKFSPIPMPPRVRSLVGMRFGALEVKHFAGQDRWHRAFWCCLCTNCGNLCRVPGSRLLGNSGKDRGHSQKSCGCLRADPGVRAAARLKVPREKRIEICNKMRAAVDPKNRKPAFSMDAHRAAELLGVSVERVEILAQDGLVGHTYRRGALFVSSGDVASLLSRQERNKRHCKTIEEWEESLARRKRNDGGEVPHANN